MIKELKNVFLLLVILLFIFFTFKYYYSDEYKKKSYRSKSLIFENIDKYKLNIIILRNNTLNTIEYIENITNDKKKYNFWELLEINE
mgnify:CR=1 FL=1|jgi:hypothetical protein